MAFCAAVPSVGDGADSLGHGLAASARFPCIDPIGTHHGDDFSVGDTLVRPAHEALERIEVWIRGQRREDDDLVCRSPRTLLIVTAMQ